MGTKPNAAGAGQPIEITVADDSPLFRIGLVEVLGGVAGITVIDEAADGESALAAIQELHPLLAVLDLELPGMSGLAILNAVRRDSLATRIVLLSGSGSSGPLYDAMALGVGGFLAKRISPTRLRQAVVTIAAGGTVVGDQFQSGLAAEIRLRESGTRPTLTDRERQVLALTADGSSVSDVAARLQLSDATIKTHLHHVYEKLDVSDRAAAVARGMRTGLIE